MASARLAIAVWTSVSLATPALARETETRSTDAQKGQERTDDEKDTAREMGREALRLMHEERWAEAQALLSRAYDLVPAPTIALLEGRALEKMGRLVEAEARYVAAAEAPLAEDSPKAFRKAAGEARAEVQRLMTRIPRLTIVLQGNPPSGDRVEVFLDEQPVGPDRLGAKMPVDPGEHVVRARIGGRVAVEDHVLLKEGESKQVVLGLVGTNDAREVHRVDSTDPEPRGPEPLWGWVALGIGAAGTATGVIAGIVMLNAQDTLDSGCDPACPPGLEDDLSRFRTARTVSAVGYVTGGIGLAVGAAYLLFAPAPARTSAWHVHGDGRVVGVEASF